MISSSELETAEYLKDFAVQSELLNRMLEQPLKRSSEVFERHEHTCTCIDEGTPGEFRLAGAGILDPKGFDHVVETMRAAGVEKVTSHVDCGAVKIAAKQQLGPDATPEQIREFGKNWAERVARALGVPYEDLDKIERELDEHDASAVVVDLEGGLRLDRVPTEAPKAFTISGLATETEHVAQQVRVAVDIVLSNHGLYHDKFSSETPLRIVLVGGENVADRRHALVEEIGSAVHDLGRKVRIEHLGVVAG